MHRRGQRSCAGAPSASAHRSRLRWHACACEIDERFAWSTPRLQMIRGHCRHPPRRPTSLGQHRGRRGYPCASCLARPIRPMPRYPSHAYAHGRCAPSSPARAESQAPQAAIGVARSHCHCLAARAERAGEGSRRAQPRRWPAGKARAGFGLLPPSIRRPAEPLEARQTAPAVQALAQHHRPGESAPAPTPVLLALARTPTREWRPLLR